MCTANTTVCVALSRADRRTDVRLRATRQIQVTHHGQDANQIVTKDSLSELLVLFGCMVMVQEPSITIEKMSVVPCKTHDGICENSRNLTEEMSPCGDLGPQAQRDHQLMEGQTNCDATNGLTNGPTNRLTNGLKNGPMHQWTNGPVTLLES